MNNLSDKILDFLDILLECSICPMILGLPILVPMVIYFESKTSSEPSIKDTVILMGFMLLWFAFGKWATAKIFRRKY